MRLSMRDGMATSFVAAAAIVYVLWATGTALAGWPARETAGVVLALGFAACMADQKQIAAVYGAAPGQSRPPAGYAVLVSLLGAAALATGILALAAGRTAMTATLTALVTGLWLVATGRHAVASLTAGPGRVRPG